ncbi:MAG: transposase [Rhizobiales bacterium]|nr:transposase [Hyphomicrobiales bacterium]
MRGQTTRIAVGDPAQTCQCCNACGTVDAASRISRSRFVSTNCGSIFDADVNAAKNILKLGISPTGGLPGWPVNRAGLPAGSRKKTPVRVEARPFRAESSHEEGRSGAHHARLFARARDDAAIEAWAKTCAFMKPGTNARLEKYEQRQKSSGETICRRLKAIGKPRTIRSLSFRRIHSVVDPSYAPRKPAQRPPARDVSSSTCPHAANGR